MKGRQNVAYHKFRILECIKASKHGLRVSKIAEATRLHRSTASRLCKSLTKEGYIKRRNKQAAYELTEKSLGDPAIVAFSLGTEGWDRMRKWATSSLVTKIEKIKLSKAYIGNRNTSKRKRNNLLIDQMLKVIINESAKTVGALIIYHFLCALIPRKITTISKNPINEAQIEPTDEVLFRWLDNAIKPGLIFHEFSRLPMVENMFLPYTGGNSPAYRMIDKGIKKLFIAYEKLYPEIYSEMEEYRKSLPKILDSYRSGAKGWSMSISK